MDGWIKLHRKILVNGIWNDVPAFRLFTLLLLKAAHKDGVKVNGVELRQGQYLRSYRKLAEDLSYKEGRGVKKYSLRTINRCLQKLIDEGIVSVEETELGTLITVLNYASYQALEQSVNDNRNGIGNFSETLEKRTRNNNKNEEEYSSSIYAHVIKTYEENFGVISSQVSQSINGWIDDLGEDLVLEAMRIAYKKNKRFWGYVEGILRDWAAKGYRSVDDVKRENIINFKTRKKQDSLEALDAYVREQGICENGIL